MRSKRPLLELQDVWKIYRLGKVEVPALRGMNIKIRRADFIVLMGSSGSGKSTAMYLMGCLDRPSKGRVMLYGKDISRLDDSELAQLRGKKIGFVFQAFNLLPNLTALENVALPMAFQGIPRERQLERARHLLDRVGLGDRMQHRPSELSGGEQQRVAIARALANDPEIILADEPTGNLDSMTGRQVMDLLVGLYNKDKKTIIVVTHDPYVAAHAHANMMYHIRDGVISRDHKLSKGVLWAKGGDKK